VISVTVGTGGNAGIWQGSGSTAGGTSSLQKGATTFASANGGGAGTGVGAGTGPGTGAGDGGGAGLGAGGRTGTAGVTGPAARFNALANRRMSPTSVVAI
jgi:hypothetical protein